MTPEKLQTIQAALKLQGDLMVRFQQMGFGTTADRIASEIMDVVLKSNVVKPEIKAIYLEVESEAQNGSS